MLVKEHGNWTRLHIRRREDGIEDGLLVPGYFSFHPEIPLVTQPRRTGFAYRWADSGYPSGGCMVFVVQMDCFDENVHLIVPGFKIDLWAWATVIHRTATAYPFSCPSFQRELLYGLIQCSKPSSATLQVEQDQSDFDVSKLSASLSVPFGKSIFRTIISICRIVALSSGSESNSRFVIYFLMVQTTYSGPLSNTCIRNVRHFNSLLRVHGTRRVGSR